MRPDDTLRVSPRQSDRECGQALVEAVLGCAVLVTVLLLIVVLGKYQAAELTAIQAARSIAFDCASLPRECEQTRPPVHSVSRWRSRLKNGQSSSNNEPDYLHSALWTTRTGDPLLESAQDAKLSIRQESFGAMPNAARRGPAGQRHSAVQIISSVAGPNRFGLNIENGLISASADLELLKSRGPAVPENILAGMSLTPSASASILTDSWNASGPYNGTESVHARVDKGWRVNKTLDKLIRTGYGGTKVFMKSMALLFLEEKEDEFKHQEIPMDLIPLDRTGETAGPNQ